MIQREHILQAWVDRFIDRVVLPPMFTSGIDVAARDMATVQRRGALSGRGVKFGLPDLFVCQAPGAILWLELKRGSRVTSSQSGVHNAMRSAGQDVLVAHTVGDVLRWLLHCGFRLHANAHNLAIEYEERVKASESAPRTPKPRAGVKIKYGKRAA